MDLRSTLVLLGIAKENYDSTVINDFVTIGQSTELEVEADDIEELMEDHCIELTTDELDHLQNEQENN